MMMIINLKERREILPIFEVANSNNEPRPRGNKKDGWGAFKTKQPKQCLALKEGWFGVEQ
jgi:hypothetical protein